ncbi:MAG TPA: hypothetical protein VLQ45_13320, partial [Thermoanaerobaculia bacterium]|nr:hypothetical protein [Thermoanaerobaculia bacterium]
RLPGRVLDFFSRTLSDTSGSDPMAERADYVFLVHPGPKPLNDESFVADLLEFLGLEADSRTQIATRWDQPDASDDDVLTAAIGEWVLPFSNPQKFRARTMVFEDESGVSGRLLVAFEK